MVRVGTLRAIFRKSCLHRRDCPQLHQSQNFSALSSQQDRLPLEELQHANAPAICPAFSPSALSGAQRLPLERLQHAIAPEVCEALQHRGYAVVEDVFDATWCSRLRGEIEALRRAGALHLNSTHLVRGNKQERLEKANIWEAELMQEHIRQACPLLAQINADTTLQTMLSLFHPSLRLTSQAIKLQYNAVGQGGCFPIHTDSDEAVDARRVTAIFYLNPDWELRHGGQLRLYPFPDQPVDIAPREGTLVLFPACSMLHRVLPSERARYCFTVWLSQAPQRFSRQQQQLPSACRHMEEALQHPQLRKHIQKLYYADEWAQSIADSHPDLDATHSMLELRHTHLQHDYHLAAVACVARADKSEIQVRFANYRLYTQLPRSFDLVPRSSTPTANMSLSCASSSFMAGSRLETQARPASRQSMAMPVQARSLMPGGGNDKKIVNFNKNSEVRKAKKLLPFDQKLMDAIPGKGKKAFNARNEGDVQGPYQKSSGKIPGARGLPPNTVGFTLFLGSLFAFFGLLAIQLN
ncbi:hypothetical protein WJX84_007705 [Apatococcus fuscideae]|uniref:Prolyl 4-hydroxylase alpha subunit domain-containing protein n=1 Tax=Apatococcus fuscideae TaxID=2026836 RepID=A0AAW1SPE8_9CHLO